MSHDIQSTVKNSVDALSAITVLATLSDWLPPLAALASLIWTCLRIFDWWSDRAKKKEARMIKEKTIV